MNRQPFGRRKLRPPFSHTIAKPVSSPGAPEPGRAGPVEKLEPAFEIAQDRSLDDELREWKEARRKNYRLPWRQISFMASACFGIGYFVLPASVNHMVQWLLLALGLLSFLCTFSPHRKPVR